MLHVVMLRIRAAVKQDMSCSAAEMVFGEALRLPGDLFVSADGDWAAEHASVVGLRQNMRQVRAAPTVWCGGASSALSRPQTHLLQHTMRCDRYRQFGAIGRRTETTCHES